MNISGYAESNFRYGKGSGVAAVSVFCGNAGYRSEEDKTPLDTGISALRSGENFSL